jgi:hypothetical protein
MLSRVGLWETRCSQEGAYERTIGRTGPRANTGRFKMATLIASQQCPVRARPQVVGSVVGVQWHVLERPDNFL